MTDSDDPTGWAALLEVMPSGVLIADAAGRFTEANGEACRILGRTREELLASGLHDPLWEGVAPDGTRVVPEAFPGVLALRGRSPVHRQVVGLGDSREGTRWLELSAGPLPGGGVAVTFEDIGDRRRDQALLAARSRILEAAGPCEGIVRVALQEARSLTGSGTAFLHDLAPGTGVPEGGSPGLDPFGPVWVLEEDRRARETPVGPWKEAILEGRAVIRHGEAGPDLPGGRASLRGVLVAPVLRQGAVVALLTVGDRARPYGIRDAETLQQLADTAWEAADRRRTQEALGDREARLREAQALTHVGHWVQDHLEGTVWWSEELYRIHGRDPSLGPPSWQGFLDRVHPDDRERLRAHYAGHLQGPGGREYDDYRIQIPESGVRHLRTRYTTERDSSGRPLRTLGTDQDVTDQAVGEEALRKAMAAMEQSPVGILLTDTAGVIEYVNSAFTEILGYTEAEVLGRTPRILKSGEHPPAFYEGIWTTLLEGRPWRGRIRNRRKDGDEVWIQATFSPLRDGRGQVTHFLAAEENITDTLRLEGERLRLEEQVARAQKMDSLGSLAGGVAHDMNNVLAAILSLASAPQVVPMEAPALCRSMDTIAKACLRGKVLVQGLLGFARQGLAQDQVMDLNQVVEEEMALLERTTLQKLRLEMDLARDLAPVRGDPAALGHALMNLCVNAVDAMPDGGTLRLRTRNVEPAQVLLEVADDGCGMPREILDKALDPFFTTKPMGKGTGLGLSIVYGTVKAHRGRMSLQSRPAEGTTVSILLPASEAAPVRREEPAPRSCRSALRVLVVDDEELVREATGHLLASLGHVPTALPSGEDAVAWLQAGRGADLVLLDLNMPGMGGAAALRRIRALRPDLPVLLATGRADQQAMDLAGAVPFTWLLAKPFSLRDLREAMAEGSRP